MRGGSHHDQPAPLACRTHCVAGERSYPITIVSYRQISRGLWRCWIVGAMMMTMNKVSPHLLRAGDPDSPTPRRPLYKTTETGLYVLHFGGGDSKLTTTSHCAVYSADREIARLSSRDQATGIWWYRWWSDGIVTARMASPTIAKQAHGVPSQEAISTFHKRSCKERDIRRQL